VHPLFLNRAPDGALVGQPDSLVEPVIQLGDRWGAQLREEIRVVRDYCQR
jgi:hypothetical protein